jgi:ribose-phosphate pyrophosphokinase
VINSQKKLKELKEAGATDVYLMAPHGIFSKNAIEKLSNSDFKKIVITDSIPNPQLEKNEKFVILPLAPLLKSVIKNIHDSESLQPAVANK